MVELQHLNLVILRPISDARQNVIYASDDSARAYGVAQPMIQGFLGWHKGTVAPALACRTGGGNTSFRGDGERCCQGSQRPASLLPSSLLPAFQVSA